MGDPVSATPSFAPAKEYLFPIRIFGRDEGGGPLQIEVQFHLTASAKNKDARVSLSFDGPGRYINVSEVVLECN